MFDRFENKTTVKGTIIALKPFHIGTSLASADPIKVDNPVLKDNRGVPIISGSSLKGVIRSKIESIFSAIDHSKCADSFKQFTTCNSMDDETNCNGRIKALLDKSDKNKLSPKERAEIIYENSCSTCRIFGNKYISARVLIKDCYFIGDPELYKIERRDGVGIDRDTGTSANGAKFDYEIVPAGSSFDFYVVAENLDKTGKKILSHILKMLEEGEISVGGKTSRGLGVIKLKSGFHKEEYNSVEEYLAKRLEGEKNA